MVACGGRTGLEEELAWDAHATREDVDARIDDADASDGDGRDATDVGIAADAGSCALRAQPPINLTIDWPGNAMFTRSLVSSGDGALVAWNNIEDPSPDRVWRVQQLMPDGRPSGVASAVRERPPTMAGYTYSSASIADGFGHRGMVAWDRVDGCRLQRLTPGGEADGPIGPRLSDSQWCGSLLATPEGYAVFMGPVGGTALSHLLRLDPAGRALGEPVRLIPEIPEADEPLWWDFRRAEDGSIIAGWMPGRFHPSSLMLRHFDPSGAPLAPPVALAGFVPFDWRTRDGTASDLTIAVVPGGLRVMWSVVRGLESDVFTVTTDLDGRVTRPVTRVEDLRVCGGCGLALAYVRGTLFFAWVEDIGDPVPGGPGHRRLLVATLDDDGTLGGAPLEVVGDSYSVESPVFAATSAGVLVGHHLWAGAVVGVSVALIDCDL